MENYYYTIEYLESLTHRELVALMDEHGYEEGYASWNKKELIEQLSSIAA